MLNVGSHLNIIFLLMLMILIQVNNTFLQKEDVSVQSNFSAQGQDKKNATRRRSSKDPLSQMKAFI
ncbi:hypothetical protein HNR39_003157 [Glaciimonas immobilis]|uniref:Uncharacterized protein n=1 Tax=Glaciimonas immobilis TaxID=728004 RepID=A0A840RW33_9BURK|nr:hypothetical protein [Glaciimonas immobilis]